MYFKIWLKQTRARTKHPIDCMQPKLRFISCCFHNVFVCQVTCHIDATVAAVKTFNGITVYERIWQMYWIWLKSTACGRFSRFLHCFSWVFNQISFHMMTNNCMRARCAACRDLRLLTFNVCAFIWINVFNEFFCRVRPTSSN